MQPALSSTCCAECRAKQLLLRRKRERAEETNASARFCFCPSPTARNRSLMLSCRVRATNSRACTARPADAHRGRARRWDKWLGALSPLPIANSAESRADANLPRTRNEQQSVHGAPHRRAPGQWVLRVPAWPSDPTGPSREPSSPLAGACSASGCCRSTPSCLSGGASRSRDRSRRHPCGRPSSRPCPHPRGWARPRQPPCRLPLSCRWAPCRLRRCRISPQRC